MGPWITTGAPLLCESLLFPGILPLYTVELSKEIHVMPVSHKHNTTCASFAS